MLNLIKKSLKARNCKVNVLYSKGTFRTQAIVIVESGVNSSPYVDNVAYDRAYEALKGWEQVDDSFYEDLTRFDDLLVQRPDWLDPFSEGKLEFALKDLYEECEGYTSRIDGHLYEILVVSKMAHDTFCEKIDEIRAEIDQYIESDYGITMEFIMW